MRSEEAGRGLGGRLGLIVWALCLSAWAVGTAHAEGGAVAPDEGPLEEPCGFVALNASLFEGGFQELYQLRTGSKEPVANVKTYSVMDPCGSHLCGAAHIMSWSKTDKVNKCEAYGLIIRHQGLLYGKEFMYRCHGVDTVSDTIAESFQVSLAPLKEGGADAFVIAQDESVVTIVGDSYDHQVQRLLSVIDMEGEEPRLLVDREVLWSDAGKPLLIDWKEESKKMRIDVKVEPGALLLIDEKGLNRLKLPGATCAAAPKGDASTPAPASALPPQAAGSCRPKQLNAFKVPEGAGADKTAVGYCEAGADARESDAYCNVTQEAFDDSPLKLEGVSQVTEGSECSSCMDHLQLAVEVGGKVWLMSLGFSGGSLSSESSHSTEVKSIRAEDIIPGGKPELVVEVSSSVSEYKMDAYNDREETPYMAEQKVELFVFNLDADKPRLVFSTVTSRDGYGGDKALKPREATVTWKDGVASVKVKGSKVPAKPYPLSVGSCVSAE